MIPDNLQQQFGNIDIYLFDQLLKGRFDNCRKIIDIGCGGGRNLHYFLQNGFEVHGIDPDAGAVEHVKQLSAKLAPGNAPSNFVVATAEQLPYPENFFDLAICSAIFHFAKDDGHFDAMLSSVWQVIKPGGYLFARLASDIGIEDLVMPVGDGVYRLPDGSIRYW
jgi:tellurite methyltransferase